MLEELKKSVCKANLELVEKGVVIYTWGNVSGISKDREYMVIFAQAGMNIPALGTTHANYFYGSIPCTRELRQCEVMEEYEINTGKVIIETSHNLTYDPMRFLVL